MAALDQRGLEQTRAQALALVDGVSDADRLHYRRQIFAPRRVAASR